MSECNKKRNKNRSRPRLKLKNAPPVKTIKDLIEIGKTINFYKNLDTVMLWKITPYLEELDKLIGMKTLKESIFYQIIYYILVMNTRGCNTEYLHTIITGMPGSGKTTVARIIGKLYQSMGILSSSGSFTIAHRDDFIAEYLGQTAIKTKKLLTSCIGGVLFIDEVYSLGTRDKDKDSFSDEALDTLTAFLSEHKNDFCCIAAGYEEDIRDRFFGKNKGLERRFSWTHKIDKYEPSELSEIMFKMVKEMEWEIGVERKVVTDIISKNKEMFKNFGGDIETYVTKCKMMHAKRVFSLGKEHRFVLTEEDLNSAIEFIKKSKPVIVESTSHLAMYA